MNHILGTVTVKESHGDATSAFTYSTTLPSVTATSTTSSSSESLNNVVTPPYQTKILKPIRSTSNSRKVSWSDEINTMQIHRFDKNDLSDATDRIESTPNSSFTGNKQGKYFLPQHHTMSSSFTTTTTTNPATLLHMFPQLHLPVVKRASEQQQQEQATTYRELEEQYRRNQQHSSTILCPRSNDSRINIRKNVSMELFHEYSGNVPSNLCIDDDVVLQDVTVEYDDDDEELFEEEFVQTPDHTACYYYMHHHERRQEPKQFPKSSLNSSKY